MSHFSQAKGIWSAQILLAPPRTRIQESTLCSRDLFSSASTMETQLLVLYTRRSQTHYGGRNISPTYQQGSCGTEQCPALQATTDCILPALQFDTSAIRLHSYSAVPKFNITPVGAHEFRERQENSASPTPHLHLQTQSPQYVWHHSPHRQRPLPSPHAQEDTVKRRRWQQEEGLGTQRSSYKHCASEECVSIASYCLPGTAAAWGHSPSCSEPSPLARRQDRTEWAATLTLCAAQPASCRGSGQTCQTLLPACQRCRGSAAPRSRCSSPGLWEREQGEQAAQSSKQRLMGLEVLGGKLASEQAKLL